MMFKFGKTLATCFFLSVATSFGDTNVNYQAPQLVSENGMLELSLEVTHEWSLNGTRFSPLFNGGPVGPTLRVRPGDKLTVTLNNKLPPSPARDIELLNYIQDPQSDSINVTKIYNRLSSIGNIHDPEFGYWGFNLVNLHFHGAGFPPSVEDLENPIDGGESRTFTFHIPDTQPPSTVWYHAHVHGNAEYQMMSGLCGAMIIEGTANDVTSIPEIANATEVVMILGEALMDEVTGMPPPFFPIVMAFNWSSTVNGRLADETHYEFDRGETVLFRAISAGVEPWAQLYFQESNAPEFLVVAEDGFPVPELKAADSVTLGVGSRMDVMVKFDEPGTYTLRREGWNLGIKGVEACAETFGISLDTCISFDVDQPVAKITVIEGTDLNHEKDMPASLPDYHQVYHDMEDTPAVTNRIIAMQIKQGFPIFQIPYNDQFVPPGIGFGINDRLLTPLSQGGVHDEVMAGSCEEWVVVSDPPGVGHAFHIHTNPYLVTHEDGIPFKKPFWRDTYTIRGSNITIKTCFNQLKPGDYVLVHCHQLTHQDIGMGIYFNVISNQSAVEPDKGDLIEEEPEESSAGHQDSCHMATSLAFALLFAAFFF